VVIAADEEGNIWLSCFYLTAASDSRRPPAQWMTLAHKEWWSGRLEAAAASVGRGAEPGNNGSVRTRRRKKTGFAASSGCGRGGGGVRQTVMNLWAVGNWWCGGGLMQQEPAGTGNRVARSASGPGALEKEIGWLGRGPKMMPS
jgi:hypothetical protein